MLGCCSCGKVGVVGDLETRGRVEKIVNCTGQTVVCMISGEEALNQWYRFLWGVMLRMTD